MKVFITNKDTNVNVEVSWLFKSGKSLLAMVTMVTLQLGKGSIETYSDRSADLFVIPLTNRQLDRILTVLKRVKDKGRLSELPFPPKQYLAIIHTLRYGIDMLC